MKLDRSTRNLGVLVAAGMLGGIGAAFFWVPAEEVQGDIQRLFYVHVPSAWIAYLAFTVVMVSSVAYLRRRSALWDLLAHASAEVGVVFTTITLLTGMLWGKGFWGTFWTWDPRLTLTFVLFLIYVGYLVFRGLAQDPGHGADVAAVLGIAGFITVPLVHFSVLWWRGLHPARTVVNPEEGPQLPPEMLWTLLWMVGVFTLLYALLLVMRMHLGRLSREVNALESSR